MTSVKVAAVSYLNTIPFIYGIEHADVDLDAVLLLSPPAGCADAIAKGEADIALIPVAEIPGIQNIKVIGSHCIGAKDTVRTVVLLSDSPLEKIEKIYLDPHSRTSVSLVQVLAAELWHIDVEWLPLTDFADVKPQEGVGYTLIGDKVFNFENKFRYNLDLAGEWNRLTGLPFVFAAWVARDGIPDETVDRLEKALDYGVSHISDAARQDLRVDYETAVSYLTCNIDFKLDSLKRKAMELFWVKLEKRKIRINPG